MNKQIYLSDYVELAKENLKKFWEDEGFPDEYCPCFIEDQVSDLSLDLTFNELIYAFLTGALKHLYDGECPDETNRQQTDVCCVACLVLRKFKELYM